MASSLTSPPERIAKRIARAGLCSRREAETWIEAGRVKLNGKKLTTPAITVTDEDQILVDGAPLPEKDVARLWLYHKPEGLVTTHKDPQGRQTVFNHLPKDLPRVISIGRLDLNTEGLLLLTNDGALARHLELPSTGWIRRYRARVFGEVNEKMIAQLKKGTTVDGVHYGPVEVTIDRTADKRTEKSANAKNIWVTVALKEGKNREIRKLFEHYNCQISRLMRLSYGPFQLGALPKGAVKEVSGKALKESLGKWQ